MTFGRSIMASMLCAYYDRTVDSRSEFERYKIYTSDSEYDNEKYINKNDVILINIQDFLSEAKNVDRLIINLNTSDEAAK